MRRRRDRMTVMADIVKVCAASGGHMKTSVIYGANLSFLLAERYLKHLVEKGLLEKRINGSRVVYVTTRKGKEYLKALDKAKSLLEPKHEW